MSEMLITCFADEISHDLDEQMDVLEQEGVKHMELRNLWGKNVLELTDGELKTIGTALAGRGFAVSSIGSPLGKYPVEAPFQPQLDGLKRAVAAAHAMQTPYIRIFSFHPPERGWDHAAVEEVLRRIEQFTKLAEENRVVLILENDNTLYGDHHEKCLQLLRHCPSPSLRMAFDPGNFVRNGVKPMTEAYPLVEGYVDYIHVKDARQDMFVPAGEGEGEMAELISALKARSFSGFLSVEPHLKDYLPHSSDPKRVVAAIRALKRLLAQAEASWR